MARGKVFTPEELRKRKGFIEDIGPKMTGTEPIVLEVPECLDPEPEVIKAPVIRLESPPVGVEPTDQTPKETLSSLTERKEHELSVAEVLSRAGINPVQELLDAYHAKNEDPDSPDFGKFLMSPGERRALMKELMKYTHPQLKSVEHLGGGADNKIVVVLQMPDGTQKAKEIEARGKPIDI